jgi:hypothetical protein
LQYRDTALCGKSRAEAEQRKAKDTSTIKEELKKRGI